MEGGRLKGGPLIEVLLYFELLSLSTIACLLITECKFDTHYGF